MKNKAIIIGTLAGVVFFIFVLMPLTTLLVSELTESNKDNPTDKIIITTAPNGMPCAILRRKHSSVSMSCDWSNNKKGEGK